MEQKIDKLFEEVSEIKQHLAAYNVQLEIHIKRTTALEEQLVPLQKQSNMVMGVLGFISLLSLLATIYSALK